eukprot:5976635-Prorocentrum_lima.AAC.1
MAERLPQELDDAIKKEGAAFYIAAKQLEPDQLKDLLPMSLPMTHLLEEEDGNKHFGIARYPIDDWKARGEQ